MMTTLNIEADAEVLAKAEACARKHNMSVAEVVRAYLESLPQESPGALRAMDIPPESTVAKLAGLLTLPRDKTVDDLHAFLEHYVS